MAKTNNGYHVEDMKVCVHLCWLQRRYPPKPTSPVTVYDVELTSRVQVTGSTIHRKHAVFSHVHGGWAIVKGKGCNLDMKPCFL
jgi:hypothetical protein